MSLFLTRCCKFVAVVVVVFFMASRAFRPFPGAPLIAQGRQSRLVRRLPLVHLVHQVRPFPLVLHLGKGNIPEW